MKENDPGKPCPKVTKAMALEMHRLNKAGWLQSRIAAQFDVNQGRVSEVLTGKRHSDVFEPEPPTLF